MSLISPENVGSKNIFKWGNNFSWTYNGEVTDSIKDRVKKAGGNVEGVLRCSLSWFNHDDLDIHVIEPDGNNIYYNNKKNFDTTGKLDVDMNDAVYIGNSDEDILTCKNAGIFSVLIDRKEHKHDLKPDKVIESLYEIADLA